MPVALAVSRSESGDDCARRVASETNRPAKGCRCDVRELRNTMEGMIILDKDGRLDVDDLPTEIAPISLNTDSSDGYGFAQGADSLVGRPLEEVEKYYIQRALELTGGKREEAAHLLGIGERTMYRKIKEFDIKG